MNLEGLQIGFGIQNCTHWFSIFKNIYYLIKPQIYNSSKELGIEIVSDGGRTQTHRS
jgi:hypothetical protein